MRDFEHIAQSIVEQFSTILDIPISITDEDGLIIGCTDSHRLGTHHIATSEVTRSGKVMFYSREQSAALKNVLPGIATPLQFQQQTVGVLGLIGEPSEVERYVSFVQTHIEMLLMEKFRYKTVHLQMETIKDFIHLLLTTTNEKRSERILSYAQILGISLALSRRCILVEIQLPTFSNQQQQTTIQQDLFLLLRNLFMENQQDIVAPLNEQQWIVLKYVQSDNEKIFLSKLQYIHETIVGFLDSKDLICPIKIVYGNAYEPLETCIDTYEQSRKALEISKRQHFAETLIAIEDWRLLSLTLFEEIDLPAKKILNDYVKILHQHPNGEALAQSFIVYCDELLNISQAAKKLFIHRNTMIYRIQQLQELLSIDFQSFQQCMLLYLALKQNEPFTDLASSSVVKLEQ